MKALALRATAVQIFALLAHQMFIILPRNHVKAQVSLSVHTVLPKIKFTFRTNLYKYEGGYKYTPTYNYTCRLCMGV